MQKCKETTCLLAVVFCLSFFLIAFSLYIVFRYKPHEHYERNRDLKRCIHDSLCSLGGSSVSVEVWDLWSLLVCIVLRYKPRDYYEKNKELKQCIDEIASGFFSPEDPALFRDLASALLNHDRQDQVYLFFIYFNDRTCVTIYSVTSQLDNKAQVNEHWQMPHNRRPIHNLGY